MTPPATAVAAPRLAPGSRRRAPARPRRVSGPGPSARATAAVAIPAPGVALPRQRPAAPRRRPARRAVRATDPRGIALRVIDTVEGISSSSLLDRLIRGRVWIGLLAFALIGIVAMQLLVLELNTGIGHKLTRVAQLQIANARLGIEDSGASAEARVDPLATAAGMTFAPAGSVHFLVADAADATRAAGALSALVKAPPAGSSEPSPSEASSSSQVAETTTSGSEARASTAPSTAAESGAGETSSEVHETPAPPTGQTASSATASETSGGSPESAAASPTGAGGGVQAGAGE